MSGVRRGRPVSRSKYESKIFRYIVQYKMENDGCAPTYEEIMEACGVSTKSMVNYVLLKLQKKGKIYIPDDSTRRYIRVIGGSWRYAGGGEKSS